MWIVIPVVFVSGIGPTGPGTDLRMSLDRMHAINDLNFPPGKVYTAPVVDTVEG